MTYISSIGTSLPEYNLNQDEIKQLVNDIFPRSARDKERLLPVFEHANILQRQFVVPKIWFTEQHSFSERNDLYKQKSIEYSLEAMDNCLTNSYFLDEPVPYNKIDAIIYVSSTGISTPSIDAHLINHRDFRNDVVRIPIWGLGCAGGASGIARAHDWLTSNPTANALVVSVELCSLTFQKDDAKKSNFIGTALFGDGIAAALLVGDNSELNKLCRKNRPKINATSSLLKKNSLNVMGWEISNDGFEVVFAKSIPNIVKTFWKEHIFHFLLEQKLTLKDISFFIAHPGGTKVLQAMKEVLNCNEQELKYSYKVLKEHGNMSSATIFYVLQHWMQLPIEKGSYGIVSALGPGFSSELLSLEWSS